MSKQPTIAQLKRRRRKLDARKLQAAHFGHQDIVIPTSTIEAAELANDDGFLIHGYTGGALRLPNFDAPVYVDCSDVKAMNAKQLPILRDHKQDKPLGHGRPDIHATDGLFLRESKLSHKNEHVEEVRAAAASGFSWQASIGGRYTKRPRKLRAGQTTQVNGRSVNGPAYIVSGFLWKEQTICALGADEERATARIAATGAITMDFEKWLLAMGFTADDLNQQQLKHLQAKFDAEQAIEAAAADDGQGDGDGKGRGKGEPKRKTSASGDVNANLDDEIADQRQRAITQTRQDLIDETNRQDKMKLIHAKYKTNVPEKKMGELFAMAINDELSADGFEKECLLASRAEARPVTNNGGSPDRHSQDNPLAIEAALMESCGMDRKIIAARLLEENTQKDVEQAMNIAAQSNMRGFSLQDLCYATIHAAGQYAPSTSRFNDDVIRAAMQIEAQREVGALQAASTVSHVSLTGILSRVANKAMLATYMANLGIISRIASSAETNDFKKFDRHRMTASGDFEKVGPSGELSHGQLSEESYDNQVETWGRMFSLTRQMQRNDDLGAFMQIPRLIGQQSARSLVKEVLSTIAGLSTAETSTAAREFFHGDSRASSAGVAGADKPNYAVGADTALGIDSLGVAYKMFLDQTDTQGEPVMLVPAVLLVTTKNAVLARQIYSKTELRFTEANKTRLVANEWEGMFAPEQSPYLGTAAINGGTANEDQWFLLCEASEDYGIVQVAYLQGEGRSPTIQQSDLDFSMLGIRWRGFFDFGVNAMDPRCGVRMKGKA